MADKKDEKKSVNASATPENTGPKDVILIAEDSAPNRKILQHLLEKLGFDVVACSTGFEAFQHLKMNKTPNIVAVISDIMMPEMDGITLLRSVREEDSLKTLPFVLVTAVSEKEYIVQAKELNVNGYILKPVTYARVQSKLQELFPKKVFPKLAA